MIFRIFYVALLILHDIIIYAQKFIEYRVYIRFTIDNKIYIAISFPAACKKVIILIDQVTVFDAVWKFK